MVRSESSADSRPRGRAKASARDSNPSGDPNQSRSVPDQPGARNPGVLPVMVEPQKTSKPFPEHIDRTAVLMIPFSANAIEEDDRHPAKSPSRFSKRGPEPHPAGDWVNESISSESPTSSGVGYDRGRSNRVYTSYHIIVIGWGIEPSNKGICSPFDQYRYVSKSRSS